MFRFLLPLAFLAASSSSFAGELTTTATITSVANTADNIAGFAVFVSGGTGICTGWINFPENKAVSPAVYRQAYANALLAFAMGKRVRIHNYQDNSCTGANFIAIGD